VYDINDDDDDDELQFNAVYDGQLARGSKFSTTKSLKIIIQCEDL